MKTLPLCTTPESIVEAPLRLQDKIEPFRQFFLKILLWFLSSSSSSNHFKTISPMGNYDKQLQMDPFSPTYDLSSVDIKKSFRKLLESKEEKERNGERTSLPGTGTFLSGMCKFCGGSGQVFKLVGEQRYRATPCPACSPERPYLEPGEKR